MKSVEKGLELGMNWSDNEVIKIWLTKICYFHLPRRNFGNFA